MPTRNYNPRLLPMELHTANIARNFKIQKKMAIKLDKKNYRVHNDKNKKLIKKSLEECGAGRSILLDNEESIIAGNGVYEQAEKLGIPVRIIETDGSELIALKRTDLAAEDEKRKTLAMADNHTSDTSEWNFELLQQDFTPAEEEAHEDDFTEEEAEEAEPVTKPGDILRLGEHRLMCGDSTDSASVERLMGGEMADLLLTDPPYNVDYEGGTKDKMKIANDNMSEGAFIGFLTSAFRAAGRVLKPGGAFYIWHANTKACEVATALRATDLAWKQTLIWVKNVLVLGRQDYQWKHEPCLYGWKEGAAHYFTFDRTMETVQEDAGVDYRKLKKEELLQVVLRLTADTVPTTVIRENRPFRSELHPTMKPVRLFGRLIRNSSRPGETVLDTFGGSGTTLIAAEQLGRKAYLMELDPHYCDVIIARWEKLTGKKAERIAP